MALLKLIFNVYLPIYHAILLYESLSINACIHYLQSSLDKETYLIMQLKGG